MNYQLLTKKDEKSPWELWGKPSDSRDFLEGVATNMVKKQGTFFAAVLLDYFWERPVFLCWR